MFRSCPMSYYQIVMPRESAWPIMNALGHLAKVEIIDFDPEQPMINRPFANYVKRCDDLLLKISQIHKEVIKLRLDKKYYKGQFDQQTNEHSHTYLDKVEDDINRKLSSFLEHQKHHEQLLEQSQYMGHQQQVLHETLKYVGNLLFQNAQSGDQLKFDYMVGVVLTSELAQFQRVVFRITKGNAVLQIAEIPSKSYAGVMEKQQSIYILIYPNSGSYIAGKLHRLCDAMSVNKFQLPTTQQEYQNKLIDLSKKQDEISHAIATHIDSYTVVYLTE